MRGSRSAPACGWACRPFVRSSQSRSYRVRTTRDTCRLRVAFSSLGSLKVSIFSADKTPCRGFHDLQSLDRDWRPGISLRCNKRYRQRARFVNEKTPTNDFFVRSASPCLGPRINDISGASGTKSVPMRSNRRSETVQNRPMRFSVFGIPPRQIGRSFRRYSQPPSVAGRRAPESPARIRRESVSASSGKSRTGRG